MKSLEKRYNVKDVVKKKRPSEKMKPKEGEIPKKSGVSQKDKIL